MGENIQSACLVAAEDPLSIKHGWQNASRLSWGCCVPFSPPSNIKHQLVLPIVLPRLAVEGWGGKVLTWWFWRLEWLLAASQRGVCLLFTGVDAPLRVGMSCRWPLMPGCGLFLMYFVKLALCSVLISILPPSLLSLMDSRNSRSSLCNVYLSSKRCHLIQKKPHFQLIFSSVRFD